MPSISRRIALSLLLGLVMLGTGASAVTSQAQPQNEVVQQLTARLNRQSLPLKSIAVRTATPLQIDVTLQSISTTQKAAPDDPIFLAAVQREAIYARRRHQTIHSIKVTIVNQQGEAIFWADSPLDPALDTALIVPSRMSDTAVADTLRQRIPWQESALQTLDVTTNEDFAQVITVTLSVADLQAANETVGGVIHGLSREIKRIIEEQGAQIAFCRVDLFDGRGRLLLRYVNDFFPTQEVATWWQAPELTQDWFPHPMLESPSQPPPDSTSPYPPPSQ